MTPASQLVVGQTIQLPDIGPAEVTSLSHPLDPAQVTIHYRLLDSSQSNPVGFVNALKTDLFQTP